MRTVKAVSELTGISVRTLHYYDEIGLLKPSGCTEAGYRLYDDKAMERLKQILFFREFDLPLREIQRILQNPDLEKNQILRMQREMLIKKRDRLDRLIENIDRMQKGEQDMNFEAFEKKDLEELHQAMVDNMTEEQKEKLCEKYGSMEAYRQDFLKQASSEQAQKNFQKVVEWYGDKESAKQAGTNPDNPKIFSAYQNRMEDIMKRLVQKKDKDVSSFEVKALVGEYDFVAKQLYQMKDVGKMMRELSEMYQKEETMIAAMDAQFGAGASVFVGKALQAFYDEKNE